MCKIVVLFATICYDIEVIFAARQRESLQVYLLQERGIIVILLEDSERPWLFSLRYVTVCGIYFLFHGRIATFILT
jgi:hypothetical protein